MKNIKCVVIGSEDSGKTCLLKKFFNQHLTNDGIRHMWLNEKDECVTMILDENFLLNIYDAPADYDRLRPLFYPDTDVILVCFSVVSPSSFENVKEKWVPEIEHFCQKTPFLLFGTQIDLRDETSTLEKLAKNKQKPISMEAGEKLAKELKAVKYVECSALTQEGLQNIFKEVNSIVLKRKELPKKKCFCTLF